MSALGLLFFIVASASASGNDWVDLHTHPFMDDGMGTLFHGAFEGPLRARDWTATLSSQINEPSLEASGLGLWVITFYAHPVFAYPKRERLLRQIRRAEAFLAVHPEWVLARTPAQARRARAAGKRVAIFALEGASGFLETEDDLRELIDEHGIRIVTFLHLTDDHYGGAAFFRGMKGLFSPVAWLGQLIGARRDEHGVKLNKNGLTEAGAAMARKLIARHVWIDLAHASDEAQRTLIPMLEAAHQPLLYTHAVLRKYNGQERGLSDAQLAEVARTHGIVGLMPSESDLEGTPVSPGPGDCGDGLHELARQFTEVAAVIGPASTVFGTDLNGGIDHLAPPRCKTGTELDARGFWSIAQTKDTWLALKGLGVPWPASSTSFIENFLKAWSTFDSRE